MWDSVVLHLDVIWAGIIGLTFANNNRENDADDETCGTTACVDQQIHSDWNCHGHKQEKVISYTSEEWTRWMWDIKRKQLQSITSTTHNAI